MSVSISYKGFEMRGFIKKCKRFSKCPPPLKKKKETNPLTSHHFAFERGRDFGHFYHCR